jgi:S1-C subfamily serine protease
MSTTSALASFSSDLERLVETARPGVVAIQSHRARSSGFVWRPGLIVTADEALAEDGDVTVTLPGGDVVPAEIVGRDPTTDVALLRVATGATVPVALHTAPVKAGALAVVVGARSSDVLAALGSVSLAGPAWRSMRGGEIDARIELGLRLPRHAEGGVAIDATSKVFGMAVFGPRRRVLVIPAATVERVAAQLEAHGYVQRGYLGLGLHPVRIADGGMGAMVMSVDAGGPGAAAGIGQGDVIFAWDGQPVPGIRRLVAALGPDSVGRTVALSIVRGGRPVELTLTIGERPRP